MASSTKCAAVCVMRRAPHDGQKPRRLQLKATSLSWLQSPWRSLRKPWAKDAALKEGVELIAHKLRQAGADCRLGLLEKGGGVLLH